MGWLSLLIRKGSNRGRSLLAREGVNLLEPMAAAGKGRGRDASAPRERKKGRAGVDCNVANPPSFWGPGDVARVKTNRVVGFGVMVGSSSASKAARVATCVSSSTGTEPCCSDTGESSGCSRLAADANQGGVVELMEMVWLMWVSRIAWNSVAAPRQYRTAIGPGKGPAATSTWTWAREFHAESELGQRAAIFGSWFRRHISWVILITRYTTTRPINPATGSQFSNLSP
jgi:hypothetical protein